MHTILQGKRLIAFDLDGTLIDSVPDLAVAVQNALNEVGLTAPSEEHVRDWVGNGAPVLVERALTWAIEQAPDQALQASAYDALCATTALHPMRLLSFILGYSQRSKLCTKKAMRWC